MKFKVKRSKKKNPAKSLDENITDENLHITAEEDGKIVFVFKNNTPLWLIEELNNRFRCNKDRGSRCGILPA